MDISVVKTLSRFYMYYQYYPHMATVSIDEI